jgi:hypothetical protein
MKLSRGHTIVHPLQFVILSAAKDLLSYAAQPHLILELKADG